MRNLLFGLTFSLAALSAASYASSDAQAILGSWLTNDGSAKVEIVQEQGVYNGRVVWLKVPLFPADDPQGMAGKPKVDRLNPDKALQTRPIMGLALLAGFHYAGNNVWDGGTVYSPASGKSYKCKLTLASDGSLKITVGGSVFGKTVIWTRASPDRPRTAA
ncbi:MAG: DUF2147 domain-containing protein [Gammaproteobacteria bacterium]